jgi:hypothetical protein
MPTGYTAGIEDGTITDFATFALTCARAFGATIMQRDNPLSEPPKHREVAPYYADRVKTETAALARLNAMTVDEATVEAMLADERRIAAHERYQADQAEKNAKYDAMLVHVDAWTPPTSDHYALKRFMREQIELCRDSHQWATTPQHIDGAKWLAEERARAERSLESAREHYADELERCSRANAWIDALYESLNVSTGNV